MSIKGVEDYRPHADEVNSAQAAVLTVLHGLPPASLGGTEVAALRLATALKQDFHTTFFFPSHQNRPPFGVDRDHKSPLERATFTVDPSLQKDFSSTFANRQVQDAFQKLLNAGSPSGRPFDLIHIHHLTGLSMALIPMAKSQGIPVLLTLHDYWMACGRGQLMDLDFTLCEGPNLKGCATCLGDQLALGTPIAALGRRLRSAMSGSPQDTKKAPSEPPRPPSAWWPILENLALKIRRTSGREKRILNARLSAAKLAFANASAIVSPSSDLLQRFKKLGFPGIQTHGRVLGNIPPTPGPKANKAPPPTLRLIYVGSVIPTKGVHLLLDAIRNLGEGDIHLDILGPTPAFHRHPTYGIDLKRQSPPNVRWLGSMPPEEVGKHIARAHALVLPSIWHENAPVTLREALLQGIPVIASRAGGIPEIVEDGVNGLLFERGDTQELQKAILKMAKPLIWQSLSEGALKTSPKKIGSTPEDWAALYRTLIKNPQS